MPLLLGKTLPEFYFYQDLFGVVKTGMPKLPSSIVCLMLDAVVSIQARDRSTDRRTWP